ncbi:MAG TPA: hypothetical protein VM577_16180, partial [Anaerovoracaceae bacterium]|nr:hypothetical protein [Anaerovoracaceae bacterium]
LKRLRSILGILLILLSIAGLFFWEWKGRETILMEEVIVAKEEIQKGTMISSSMFITKGVPKPNMLEEALTSKDLNQLQGRVTSQLIAKNDQIIMEYFGDSEFYLDRDESIFVIDPSWISMRSSALRRGDIVDIYGSNGLGLLGTFRIAYVKDASEREVKDAGEEAERSNGSDILERTDSTSVIDHIEIISTFREYEDLVNRINGTTPAALIIVQRGDRIDT